MSVSPRALNYHHLRYFHAVAHARGVGRAAARLHVSASALSVQLRQLEERLGQPLFLREGRTLELTEAGRIALEYADAIFRTGDELLGTLQGRTVPHAQRLRVGAVAHLSRNFQRQLLGPVLRRARVQLVLHSGGLRELLVQLAAHTLDLVLSNEPAPRDADPRLQSRLLAQQPVSLVARRRPRAFRFPESLADAALAVPGRHSGIRAAFDLLLDQAGVRPRLYAEVDDMAMLRLVARDAPVITLLPPVVVQDELRNGRLVELHRIAPIKESFYAIVPRRRFPHPLVRDLLDGAARRS